MLEVKNLCKTYPTFQLQDVSFSLPLGMIVGFIGQNGAGKTTTLKCITRAVVPDSGEVWLDGMEMTGHEQEIKQTMSFTLGAFDYYRNERLKKIANVYRTFYDNWKAAEFAEYCRRFNLDLNKRVKELSAGMKVKFALALAMSHDAKIFLFDEPTSGLDPIARDEMLDVFRDIVDDGDKSILFSTHITGDLDKCADRILFIKNGRILVDQPKQELLESHLLLKGDVADLTEELKASFVAAKVHLSGFTALAHKDKLPKGAKVTVEKPTLDDIMVYYNKEDKQ